jgi:hypothetical protein
VRRVFSGGEVLLFVQCSKVARGRGNSRGASHFVSAIERERERTNDVMARLTPQQAAALGLPPGTELPPPGFVWPQLGSTAPAPVAFSFGSLLLPILIFFVIRLFLSKK